MRTWKIWNYAQAKFLGNDYPRRDNQGPSTRHRIPEEKPPLAVHLRVPLHLDTNEVTYVSEAQKATYVVERSPDPSITFTAVTGGLSGNSIVMSANGVKTVAQLLAEWNPGHPDNQAESDDDGTTVLDHEVIRLAGGTEAGEQLVFSRAVQLDYFKILNKKFRRKRIRTKELEANALIRGYLSKKTKAHQLMLGLDALFTYLDGLQTAAGIADNQLGAGTAKKVELQAMRSGVMGPILVALTTRNTAINDFSVYPHSDVTLPDGHDDDYWPLVP